MIQDFVFRHFRHRKIWAVLFWGFIVFLLWFFIHTIFVIWVGLNGEVKRADVAIVLGNKVNENGIPSPRLQSRLDRAIRLYQEGTIKKIIVSGGQGVEGHEEADIMREVLVKTGISEADIITDRNGNDTFKTAQNGKSIMETQGFKTVIVVTQYYHIARTKLAFRRFGVKPVYSAYAEMGPEIRDPYALIREFVAYYYYLLRSYPEVHLTR